MTLMRATLGLNREGQEEVIGLLSQTHQGMAHFAGTGPAGATCRECKFWQHQKTWSSETGKGHGAPMPARCMRYQQLMHEPGKMVPHDARACKHFDRTDAPQPLQRPRRAGE